ncbi:MAG: four helix bundle protein [Patescibacteria group bacterium]
MPYLELQDLDAYKLSLEYSRIAWELYKEMDWKIKKIIGDQMITSVDSVGGNIAEGYGRFHFLDKNKFYYNSRGSLIESDHWIHLLHVRMLISDEEYNEMKKIYTQLIIKINSLIKSQYQRKNSLVSNF